MDTPAVLYRNGRIFSPAAPVATALLVAGGTVAWLGAVEDAPAADEVVDLAGALLTPAFVDAHVHATDTGLALDGLDLRHTRSATEVLDAVAAFASRLPGDAVVLGHGWDESAWIAQAPPAAAELTRAGGGRLVYLSQASIHSALCSEPLLTAAPTAVTSPGYDESGWLKRDAHHAVRAVAFGAITRAQRDAAQHKALRAAAALGIASVHECGGPGTSDERDFTGLLALSRAGGVPEVYGYWGELHGAAKARELGAVGAGGDLYADGALGSHTAHLRQSYVDSAGGGVGHGYITADQVRDHLVECTTLGQQGGFHAIGDAALSTVVEGIAAAVRRLGVERIRAARHRVEHAELVDKALIAAFVEYGVVASMQPAFDRLWGGTHAMYAQRLGVARSLESNPMGAMHGVGVPLAFGSDSPVTPLDPWGTVRAAMWHHNAAHRMSARAAFAAHTRGGWRAVHQDDHGQLVPGAPATFAVWDTPAGMADTGLPVLLASDVDDRGPDDPTPLPTARLTVLRGQTIYDAEAS